MPQRRPHQRHQLQHQRHQLQHQYYQRPQQDKQHQQRLHTTMNLVMITQVQLVGLGNVDIIRR